MTIQSRHLAPKGKRTIEYRSFVAGRRISRHQMNGGTDLPFEIELASTGEVTEVPYGQTAIEALTKIGVLIPTACTDGSCGACVTRVLDGTPIHQGAFLSEAERAENAQFTPCCSRGVDRIVIDI